MSDYIQIDQKSPPWAPARTAEMVAEFHYDGIPLIGVVRQHGHVYLFRCRSGEIDPVNLWQYALIEPAEAIALGDAESYEEFDELMDSICDRPDYTTAIAVDGYGVLVSRTVTEGDDQDAILKDMFHEFRAQIDRLQASGDTQRALILS